MVVTKLWDGGVMVLIAIWLIEFWLMLVFLTQVEQRMERREARARGFDPPAPTA